MKIKRTRQYGPHDCSEGWARSAPSCEGRAPNCPYARCSDLRLGEGEGRRPDGLAATHPAFRPDRKSAVPGLCLGEPGKGLVPLH